MDKSIMWFSEDREFQQRGISGRSGRIEQTIEPRIIRADSLVIIHALLSSREEMVLRAFRHPLRCGVSLLANSIQARITRKSRKMLRVKYGKPFERPGPRGRAGVGRAARAKGIRVSDRSLVSTCTAAPLRHRRRRFSRIVREFRSFSGRRAAYNCSLLLME